MSDILLTISLLCSGRKDTTELTLRSLMPIKEKIASEIIVVDTGCDDELRAVIKKYADQIIPFTWCDDFSAARNVGVDAASGKWFMFIDDDEWFESTDDIVDFFSTGKYKDYLFAAYQVKSYLNMERTIYDTDWTLRLFSLENGNRFWGMIHEYPQIEDGPRYLLKDIADHTGYRYQNAEQAVMHSYRNIRPLEKMIEIDPHNLRWPYQLAQEYRAVRNWSAMKDLCLKSVDRLKNLDGYMVDVYRSTFSVGVILAEEGMNDKKASREHYELYRKDNRNNIFAKCMFYSIGAIQSVEDMRFKETILCANRYYEIYEKYHDRDDLQSDQAGFFVKDAMWRETCNAVLISQMIAMMRLNEVAGLNDVFEKMDTTTGQLVGEYKLALNLVDALGEHPEEEELVRLFERLCNDSRINVSIEGGLFDLQRNHKDWFANIASLADRIDSDYYFLSYLKAYDALIKNEMPLLSQRVSEIPMERFINGVDILVGSNSYDEFKKMVTRGDTLGLSDERNAYAHMKLAEKAIGRRPSEEYLEFEELLGDLAEYAISCLSFYELYFKPSAFDGEMEMLPVNAKVSVLLSRFMDVMTDDFRAAFALLKEAVPLWATTKTYLNRLSTLYGDFVKTRML